MYYSSSTSQIEIQCIQFYFSLFFSSGNISEFLIIIFIKQLSFKRFIHFCQYFVAVCWKPTPPILEHLNFILLFIYLISFSIRTGHYPFFCRDSNSCFGSRVYCCPSDNIRKGFSQRKILPFLMISLINFFKRLLQLNETGSQKGLNQTKCEFQRAIGFLLSYQSR